MLRFSTIAALAMVGAAAPALAVNGFSGTWLFDTKAQKFDPKPDMWVLRDGTYECMSCVPALKLTADGKVHAVSGRDYADAMSLTVVDANTIKTASYKNGVMYAESTRTLSADGKTLTTNWRNNNNPQNKWMTGTNVMTRVGPAPAGAHAQSGSFVPLVTEATKVPTENLTATFAIEGDVLKFSTPTGLSYSATLGGPPVALQGDKVGSMIAVDKLADNSIREITYLKGKPVSVNILTMTDNNTVAMRTLDLRGGFADDGVLRRQ